MATPTLVSSSPVILLLSSEFAIYTRVCWGSHRRLHHSTKEPRARASEAVVHIKHFGDLSTMASRQDPHEQGSKVGHAGIAGASIPIAVGKRGGQRETSAMVTNNSPHVAANKSKKTRKRFKKKKGRVEGVVVPDSDATTIPHSERLLPNSVDSVDIPITSSALMEKDTKEKQQDIPEQHEQRSGDGKDGCKYCDIVNERVVTGGSTTPPAVSGQNSVASDTEGVETINKSLDSSFSRCKKRGKCNRHFLTSGHELKALNNASSSINAGKTALRKRKHTYRNEVCCHFVAMVNEMSTKAWTI